MSPKQLRIDEGPINMSPRQLRIDEEPISMSPRQHIRSDELTSISPRQHIRSDEITSISPRQQRRDEEPTSTSPRQFRRDEVLTTVSPIQYRRGDEPISMSPRQHRRDEEPTSTSMSPTYMAVPVIRSLMAQEGPLDYHVPRGRRKEYGTKADNQSQENENQDSESQSNDNNQRQYRMALSFCPIRPDSQDDSRSFDMQHHGSPCESDSNQDSLDGRGDKRTMRDIVCAPSANVRLALIRQRVSILLRKLCISLIRLYNSFWSLTTKK